MDCPTVVATASCCRSGEKRSEEGCGTKACRRRPSNRSAEGVVRPDATELLEAPGVSRAPRNRPRIARNAADGPREACTASGLLRRQLRRCRNDPLESSSLHELSSLAAAAGHFIFCRADRLLGAAAGLDGSANRDRLSRQRSPRSGIVSRLQLDQDHAAAQVPDRKLISPSAQSIARAVAGRGDHHFAGP